jgi:hypothetical protein
LNIPFRNIQGTFREHTGNIHRHFKGTTGAISGNIQAPFQETFGAISGNVPRHFKEHLYSYSGVTSTVGSCFPLPLLYHYCLQLDGRHVETEVQLLMNGRGNRPAPFKSGDHQLSRIEAIGRPGMHRIAGKGNYEQPNTGGYMSIEHIAFFVFGWSAYVL